MAIKRNLPVLAGVALLALGLASLALFLRRSDEELIREAAAKHGAATAPVREVQIHGAVADIDFASRAPLFAEFVKKGGEWTFSKDLGQDFEQRMKDPVMSGEVLKHLAQKIADADNVSVNIREGITYKYAVAREGPDLIANVTVNFSYPKGGDKRGSGLFIETFRYVEGTWVSQSTSLFKAGPGLRP